MRERRADSRGRRGSSARGFTLVEVLVAVAMLVIVIGAIYAAFRVGNQSSVVVQESADLNQTARVILGRINSELLSMHNLSGQTGSNLQGLNSEDNGEPPLFDKLTFTTVSHQPCGQVGARGDVCTVTYAAECDKEGRAQGMFVTEDYTPDLHLTDTTTQADPLPQTRISDLVVGMDCTYLDPDTGEWVDQWVDKTALPTAVRVEIILQSARKGTKPVTVASTTNLPTWANPTTATPASPSGGTSGG